MGVDVNANFCPYILLPPFLPPSLAVLYERPGDLIAHVKFTVLVLGSGNAKVGGLEFPAGLASDKVLPEDIQAILATEDKKKKKRPKKKAAGEA